MNYSDYSRSLKSYAEESYAEESHVEESYAGIYKLANQYAAVLIHEQTDFFNGFLSTKLETLEEARKKAMNYAYRNHLDYKAKPQDSPIPFITVVKVGNSWNAAKVEAETVKPLVISEFKQLNKKTELSHAVAKRLAEFLATNYNTVSYPFLGKSIDLNNFPSKMKDNGNMKDEDVVMKED